MGKFTDLVNKKTTPEVVIPNYSKPNLNTDLKISASTGKELSLEQLPTVEKAKAKAEIRQSELQLSGKKSNFLQVIAQAFPRAVMSFGLETVKRGEMSYTPKTNFEKVLYGEEPIKSVSQNAIANQPLAEQVVGEKAGLPTAVGLTFLGTFLDLTPFGGTKKGLTKEIVSIATEDAAKTLLKKAGVADDLAEAYAKQVVKAKTAKEAEAIITRLDELAKTTQVAKGTEAIDPLAQEARKYKSAEEFVKAQGDSFFHTTPNSFDKFDKSFLGSNTNFDNTKVGFYFTDSPEQIADFKNVLEKGFGGTFTTEGAKKTPAELAKYRTIEKITKKENFFNFNYNAKDLSVKEARDFAEFADKKMGGLYSLDGDVVNHRKMTDAQLSKFLKENVFVDDLDQDSSFLPQFTEQYLEDFTKFLEKKGYKGMISDYGKGKNEYLIFDPNILPTKSQLTDIYNKAVKTTSEAQLGVKVKPKSLERGFITSAKEVVPEAKKIAGQYIPRSTDNLAIKAKNLIKTDLNTAENLALTGTDENAVATASELLKHYAEQADLATDQAIKNALYDKAAQVANTIAPKLTEQGRAIQAASILGRLTPEGQVKFAAGQISKYNEKLPLAKRIPELTGEQANKIINEMKEINSMEKGTEQAIRFQKLQDYISKLVPTPLIKKVIAVWKAGLLTGWKTTGLNIFANLSHAGSELLKDIPATMVDKIASLFTGKRTVAFNAKGLTGGAKEGLEKGLRYLKTGFDERNIGTKLDFEKVNFGKGKIAQALQTYTDTVFKILGTEDQPFYYAAKMRSLYEQSKVAAINKGLKGSEAQKFIDELMQNPLDDMVKYASTDAEMAVFQNQTLLSKAASGITRAVPAAEVIIPFRRTPSAVAMQIFNYSPAGIVKTIFENVGKGKFDQRLFAKAMGRGLTGTGALALGAYLYKKGMVTTARPTSEKERELWRLEGKTPNSIKIGNKWRTIQFLGPIGNVLLIGGSFQKSFDNSGSPTEAMAEGLADASQSFTQQTFLTGVSNFIDAVSDPARSAEYVAGSTLASSIPTIVSDVARATDTKERRAESIWQKIIARIPGIRQTLEPQVSVLGEEIGTIGNPLEIMADPTRPSKVKDTPVISELRRLWDAGFNVSPTLLGDKKGYKGLSQEENTELWKRAGEITNSKLNNLFNSEKYQKLQNDEKGKVIENFVDKAKINARAEIVVKLTNGLNGEELKKKLSALKESGVMTREVYNKYLEIK